jgi:large-conductance mechanosensitive channel
MDSWKNFIKNYPLIDIAVVIIIAMIPFLIAGEDSVISAAMIQAGWCGYNDPICLLRHYVYIAIIILAVGIVLQIIFNKIFQSKLRKKLFTVRMTKRQFEKELDEFINPPEEESGAMIPPKSLLDTTRYWRTLRRIKTELESKILSGSGSDFMDVDTIELADNIKLIKEPFCGIVLELKENGNSLTIGILPEGYRETIDTSTLAGWLNDRSKLISVDSNAERNLLIWLKSLEERYKHEKD